ncbi:MAG: hypothetical protein KDI44_16155 [Thiothrix sp.]|nr:hypothetical protein [Thiothrix sp.]
MAIQMASDSRPLQAARTYHEISCLLMDQKNQLRAALLAAGYQHIRIEERPDGLTEIHATGPATDAGRWEVAA